MNRYPYLLVAEESLLSIITHTVESLEKYADPSQIYLVVPAHQFKKFRLKLNDRVVIISEDEVLPNWSINRIKSFLPNNPSRAGWYLQQFLKLCFGSYSGLGHYVIWDADTIMLNSPQLLVDGRIVMNRSKEYHQPYFDTYLRLFGIQPTLTKSMISQYMLIDYKVCLAMQNEIIRNKTCQDWIGVVLEGLPGRSISEFSEYETYANFFAKFHPDSFRVSKVKWFRYGAYIINDVENVSFYQIRNVFNKYNYVAFERHSNNHIKKILAIILLKLSISS